MYFYLKDQIQKSIFVGQNRKPSVIRKKTKFSGLSGVSGAGRQKWTSDLDSTGQKKTWIVSHQSRKFLLSRKFRVNNNEFVSCNYLNREKVKNVQNGSFFCILFKVVYFDLQNSNPMSIFVGRDRKTSISRKFFPDYRDFQIRWQGSLEEGCDGTLSTPSALQFVPRCLQSALSRRSKLQKVIFL